jgi:hypothetical protein
VSATAPRRAADLSLYVACGDLVVAFAIDEIARVLLADDRTPGFIDPKTQLSGLSFEGELIPAWDLGYLLGLRQVSAARTWIVIAAAIGESRALGVGTATASPAGPGRAAPVGSMEGKRRQFAVSCDRSLAVRPSQVDLVLPGRLFNTRVGAVTAAFTTQALDSQSDLAPTGVALSAAHLLGPDELRAVAGASAAGKLMW